MRVFPTVRDICPSCKQGAIVHVVSRAAEENFSCAKSATPHGETSLTSHSDRQGFPDHHGSKGITPVMVRTVSAIVDKHDLEHPVSVESRLSGHAHG
jgi:hypothetical protein